MSIRRILRFSVVLLSLLLTIKTNAFIGVDTSKLEVESKFHQGKMYYHAEKSKIASTFLSLNLILENVDETVTRLDSLDHEKVTYLQSRGISHQLNNLQELLNIINKKIDISQNQKKNEE
tara:strand:- start:839 stop:1198 length:360 start_codon:yes stop_codon:yes gene_type:complete